MGSSISKRKVKELPSSSGPEEEADLFGEESGVDEVPKPESKEGKERREKLKALVEASDAKGLAELLKNQPLALEYLSKPTNKYGWTPLILTALNGHAPTVKVLVEHKASLQEMDNNGDTPLIGACVNGKLDTVRLLLKFKANPNHENNSKSTALMRAAKHGHVDTVKVLLDAQADVNHQDKYGVTALMKAASHGQLAMAQLLVARGADINIKDKNGQTALELTQKKHKCKTVASYLDSLAKTEGGGASPTTAENKSTPAGDNLEQIVSPTEEINASGQESAAAENKAIASAGGVEGSADAVEKTENPTTSKGCPPPSMANLAAADDT